jgi:eukaryotic translation initiation factor 2C
MTNFDTSSTEFSLLVGLRKRLIGAGMSLWRGNFQSLRPVIGRMLINVDISTGAMYRPGKLIDLALEFLGNPGTPFSLAPRDGLSDHERLRLQQFISGIDITMPHRAQDPDRRRLVKKLTRESARDLTFQIGDGETMVVAEYIKDQLDVSLRFPDLICVEVCTTRPDPLARPNTL